MSFDLVIRGAKVVDGTGLPGYVADVGIRGERIGRIGRITESAETEIDGRGLVPVSYTHLTLPTICSV